MIALARGPWCAMSRSSVSTMCVSRTFHADEREVFLEDEPLRDLGPPSVELGRAVARLAEQHVPRTCDAVDEHVEVVRAFQWAGDSTHRSREAVDVARS